MIGPYFELPRRECPGGCMYTKQQAKFHFDNIYWYDPKRDESIILYQIGDLSCERGHIIGNHVQFCYEISYIASGRGYLFTDGCSYPVKQGDIFLSLPEEQHCGIADTIDPFRIFYVAFNFSDLQDGHNFLVNIRKMFDQKNKPVVPDRFDIQNPFISILNELKNLKDYSYEMIKAYLQQIIVLAYRDFFDKWENRYTPRNNMDETKQIVYDIISYIDVNLGKITELTQISNALSYSYSYLSHVFSKEIGLTIKEYYNRKRFEKAVEWLKNSNMTVTLISEKLQYQSIHTFSKAFHKNFGISPTKYQSLHKN